MVPVYFYLIAKRKGRLKKIEFAKTAVAFMMIAVAAAASVPPSLTSI